MQGGEIQEFVGKEGLDKSMQAGQQNISDAFSNIPVKRKRGRPRKYPRLDPQESAAPVRRYQSLNLGENAVVSPLGFVRSNGNHSQQAAPTNGTSTTDNMVGMPVSGVVEASFDAGYLLRVRVGNTGTTLRGVVFKAGQYAPVVPENDVAPDVEMIRRHEIPLPIEKHSSVHGHKPHSRDASRPVNHVASEDRQVVPVAAQSVNQVMPRGNLMPVVLEPCKVSNGVAVTSESNPVAIQAENMATSKGKEIVIAAPLSAFQNKMPRSEPQASHQVMNDGKPNEIAPIDPPSAEEWHKTEGKQMRSPENVPSESARSHVEASNLATQCLVEPLQAVEHKDPPTSASKPMEDGRNDKMSELLQVLQESMTERMKDQTEELFGDGNDDHPSTPQAS